MRSAHGVWRRRILCAGVATAFLAGSADGAEVKPAAEIDAVGRWSLESLGAGAMNLPVNRRVSIRSIPIRFSRDAHQPTGPGDGDLSYRIHLDTTLKVARNSGSGVAIVSAATRGCKGAMLNVHVRARPDGPPTIRWNSIDLIQGVRGGVARERLLSLRLSNYLPYCAVAPGEAGLSFELQQLGKVKLERVRVLRSSGLEVTRRQRAQLKLRLTELPAREPEPGERFDVGYEVENVGDLPARQIHGVADVEGQAVGNAGKRSVSLGELKGGGTKGGSFAFQAYASGDFGVEIRVASLNTNVPRGGIDGVVVPRGSRDDSASGLAPVLIWGAGTLIVGVLIRRLWKRNQRTAD